MLGTGKTKTAVLVILFVLVAGVTGNSRRESSSLFFDVSFNIFSLARFEAEHQNARFLSASAGFSWLLPGGTGKDGSNGREQ